MKQHQQNNNSKSEQDMQDTHIPGEEQLPIDENMAAEEIITDSVTDAAMVAELEKTQAELADYKDKYIRLSAEFDNYRKRTAKERIELIQNASGDLIQSLLDVLDDADRSLDNLEKNNDTDSTLEGVKIVFHKLKQILQSKGLESFHDKGEDFTTDRHEAITEIEAGDNMKGKIVDTVQTGYKLNDKMLRHAKVVVGK